MIRRHLFVLAALTVAFGPPAALAQGLEVIRVATCSRTLTSSLSPFAIAQKFGWFEKAGIKVEIVPVAGSGECTKLVATGELPFSLPSIEPVAIIRPQGVDLKFFYTAYQGNIYGLAVPADGPLKTIADLKGKKIGVTGMSSGGVIVARALAAEAGLDPQKDITIIAAGEGVQTALLLEQKQIDALSQFDSQYALVENAGMKLRYFEHPSISKFPSNGFIATAETLKTKRAQAIAMARGYAMGSAFAMANPEAAVRIMWQMYPQTRGTGRDEATALRDDIAVLKARAKNWELAPYGAKRWGDNIRPNYAAFIDWLVVQGVLKQKIDVADVLTDDLLPEINAFDQAAIEAQARAWTGK